MRRVQWRMESKIGDLFLVASEGGLSGVHWRPQAPPGLRTLAGNSLMENHLAEAVRQIELYLEGELKSFDLPCEVEGSDFQKRVWDALCAIPYGKTRTYGEIAEIIGHPRAARAVGTANGRNPLSLIVPCHRVIAGDGTLGGYAGGLTIKARLLQIERSAGNLDRG